MFRYGFCMISTQNNYDLGSNFRNCLSKIAVYPKPEFHRSHFKCVENGKVVSVIF